MLYGFFIHEPSIRGIFHITPTMLQLWPILLILKNSPALCAWAPLPLTATRHTHSSPAALSRFSPNPKLWSTHSCNRESKTPLFSTTVQDYGVSTNIPHFTHTDITWKIRPEESATLWRKLHWRVAGIILRLACRIQKHPLPRLLFPVSGQAVLLAYQGRTKLGRFGIVTQAGPVTPQLVETVQTVYQNPNCVAVRAAAVIYMFVEPKVRGRSLGALALETIGYLHAARGCDHTVLVANDKSSDQSLIQWYERHGYSKAPALQAAFGSPDGIYGVTMIAPTKTYVPDYCVVQWW